MLTLSRRKGERIVIEGGIEIEVLKTGSGRVRLGVHAPREVRVRRGELVKREQRESQTAAVEEKVA